MKKPGQVELLSVVWSHNPLITLELICNLRANGLDRNAGYGGILAPPEPPQNASAQCRDHRRVLYDIVEGPDNIDAQRTRKRILTYAFDYDISTEESRAAAGKRSC
ncbi:hypothetical protein C1H46_022391 [Malus baccata]|uniref:Uncharacterized protein n=1 Tax=Malus baccata TaxID=106549 RepID=A0A540LZS0_MALBA|nr:hypothetical protein C1H46_022391 [Malus baccata]